MKKNNNSAVKPWHKQRARIHEWLHYPIGTYLHFINVSLITGAENGRPIQVYIARATKSCER
eukprot:scaffold38342_cov74-Attheya_sp.AAC.2